MAASIKDIVNSCLALANNNSGLFKSEKQAKFLSGFFVDGSFTASVAYSFGEFNGCTRRVDYVITINETGIQKIVKNGAVYWENTPEQISKQNAVKARRDAAHKKELQEIVDYQIEYVEKLQKEISVKQEALKSLDESCAAGRYVINMIMAEVDQQKQEIRECEELIEKYQGYINK